MRRLWGALAGVIWLAVWFPAFGRIQDAADLIGLLVLVLGTPLCLAVVLMLRAKSKARPELRLLRKDLITAAVILANVTVFGLIFVNNDMDMPLIDTVATRLITRLVALALALTSVIFLWTYRRLR